MIARKFKNMSKIASASVQELTAIDTIGMTIAESLTAYFQQEEAKKLLARLEEAGVNMDYLGEDGEAADNFFKGKTVVLTGKLAHYSRAEFTKKLQALGAKVTRVSLQEDRLPGLRGRCRQQTGQGRSPGYSALNGGRSNL